MIQKIRLVQAIAIFALIICCDTLSMAQPVLNYSFPAGAPALGEMQFSISTKPEWINMDIFDDNSVQETNNHSITAITWDEWDVGNSRWVCSLYVYDEASSTGFYREVATDARHPDVVILDLEVHGFTSASPGNYIAAIAFENNITDNIEISYFDLGAMMGHGGPAVVSSAHCCYATSAGWGIGKYPHIDAIPDDLNNTPHFPTGFHPDMVGLGDFALTWTEDDAGSKRVYLQHGYLNAANHTTFNGSPIYIGPYLYR